MPSKTPIITTEKLSIYHKYAADKTRFEQEAPPKEKRLFAQTTWSLIDQIYRSIELAQKEADPSRITSAIMTLQYNCDPDCFKLLSGQIPFYQDFQKTTGILNEIRDKIHPETDLSATGDETYFSFMAKMLFNASRLGLCEFDVLDQVYIEFLPTGTYQELAMANGWGEEYLGIAERFDVVYRKLKEDKDALK